MSEIAGEFIRIKNEILDLSNYILEHLEEFKNFNFTKFNQDILSIQSKLSTLGSLSKSRPRNLGKFKNQADVIIGKAMEAKQAKGNLADYAWKMGYLSGITTHYLTEINSVLMRIE
ncbi:MAG: hypothetical protein ACFFDN_33510 [Candidatus Hodarchaeota archaeon]